MNTSWQGLITQKARSKQNSHNTEMFLIIRRSLTILLAIGLCVVRVSALEAAEDGQCKGGVYGDVGTAQARFVDDCGMPYANRSSYSCSWVSGGWQCKGPSSRQGNAIYSGNGTVAIDLGNDRCAGGIYPAVGTAQNQFVNDCGRIYAGTASFRCDWANGGWQCQGPGKATSRPLLTTPGGTVNDQAGTDMGNGVCAGGIYDDATTAKTRFLNDCGKPFLNRSSYSCAWGAGGWQCQGYIGNTGNTLNKRPAAIVSMGDSYLAGEAGRLVGNNNAERRPNAYDEGTDVAGGNQCHRSDVAPIHSSGIRNVTQFNIACSGASITDVIGSSGSSRTGIYGERLQIDQLRDIAVSYDVQMVAVSIGGDDIGLSDLAEACIVRYSLDSTCEKFEGRIIRERVSYVADSRVRKTVEEIKRVLAETGQSGSRIVLQSYPSMVPASTDYYESQRLSHGCTLRESDMRFINSSLMPRIDSTYRRIADELGVEFLSLVDAFDGKEVCSPFATSRRTTSDRAELEWTTGFRLGTSGKINSESLHPNALGQQALGRCLELVWNSSEAVNTCHNNGGEGWDMRLGGNSLHPGGTSGSIPVCLSATSDNDRDGMGWENGRNCMVNIAPGDIDCEDMKAAEARICGLVLDRINEEIENGKISLSNNGLLFSYLDKSEKQLGTSSCSARSAITKQQATALISSDTRLNLKGNSISEPLVLRLELPFALSARVDAKTTLGSKWQSLWARCDDYASDSYNAKASLSGIADVLIVLDLGAEIYVARSGDLVFRITPKVVVATDLRNPDLKFKFSKVNPLAQFAAAVISVGQTIANMSGALLAGDSVGAVASDGGLDIGIPVGLSLASQLTAVPYIKKLLESYGENEARREAQGVSLDIEKDLNKSLASALGLNSVGYRSFVIKRDFAGMLGSNVKLTDLLAYGR